jgi:tetratricopeptide (TPR) repeat protein
VKPVEPGFLAVAQAVREALDLPVGARAGCLAVRCPDHAQRSAAEQLLRACHEAEASPVLDGPAVQFAAPLLDEALGRADVIPEQLQRALADRYAIERELARGGQATVYLARDERHGRLVALKVMRPVFFPDEAPPRAAARFQREIQIAARLSHPHILPLYDSGVAAGQLYYITPYVDGESLRDRLARRGRLSLAQTLRVLRDVVRALAHAHRQGVVHRDIKPANILLNTEGDALVSDFGVAKALVAAVSPIGVLEPGITDGALVLGTPAYMAPEQARGGSEIDHRADLYSLGVVAYELLTGATPFTRSSRRELLAALLSENPVPLAIRQPGVPASIAALVDRLLSRHPGDRPRNAAKVLDVLDAAATGPVVIRAAAHDERDTANVDAHELYQKGRFLFSTRQRDGLFSALRHFTNAVAIDPNYARAYAGIADAHMLLGILGCARPHDAFPQACAAAQRALALDNQLVDAHAALAHERFVYEWDWEAAGQAFERAVALDARYPSLRMYYASYLHSVGRSGEALAQLQAARALDPLTPNGVMSGRILVDTGQTDTAIRILREEVELDPRRDLAHQLLAHAYLQKGMNAEAIDSMQRAAALSGPRDLAQLAYVFAVTGDTGEARRILSGLLANESRPAVLGFHLAMAYAGLGDADEAFRWLEAAFDERGSFMNLLGVSAGFESVRADRRYEDLLRRMGLRPAARSMIRR